MLTALYARYSTDKQRTTSVEDQLALARQRAVREGFQVFRDYRDEETSGSLPIESRPGSKALMADARAGLFNVLIIEALDRFSRDTVDQERMIRRLEALRIRIIGLSDGYDSNQAGRELMRQIRGSVNEEQLRVIGHKVHRGLTGQISRGYHAGGLSYGYRSVVVGVDARGNPIGHRLEIDPQAAGWVRWMFEGFARGKNPQDLAYELNRLGVPGPRGTWARSAIYGNPARGSGILNNELYIGRYVWNRSKWLKDPDTQKKVRLERPREEWVVAERPELRIISEEVWQAARARLDGDRLAGGTRGKGAKVKALFSGQLRCGECGGAMVQVNHNRYGCVARKERGPSVCKGTLAPKDVTDDRLMSLARDELLTPEAITEYRLHVRRLLSEHARTVSGDQGATKARLTELANEIRNLVEAITATGISPALQGALQRAEAEQARLKALVATKPAADPQAALPAVVANYRAHVLKLQAELNKDAQAARIALQELLGPIRMVRSENGEMYAEVDPHPQRAIATGGAYLGVVAGIRSNTQIRIKIC